jgi:6-phosphofructokinase
LLPAMAGAADRCLIPEYKFDLERLTELLVRDRYDNPSKYAIVLISEGAMVRGEEMVFSSGAKDAFGHAKLGGIGDLVSMQIKELSAKFNHGQRLNVLNQKLGYIVRGGDPDAVDSIVPMVYGNLALNLILKNVSGRLVALKDGRYGNVELEEVTSHKKVVDIEQFYDKDNLCPKYTNFEQKPMLIMTSE